MPLDTAPQLSTATSASTHSTTVLARMEAVWPGSRPSACRPAASSRTASPVWRQLQLFQMPSFFCRIQTWSPRSATAFQNMAGMVSPGTTSARPGWIWLKSHKLLIASPPCLFLFPAQLAAHAGFLHAEVELLDVLLLAQAIAAIFHDDAAVLQHIAVVRGVEGHVGVLLDQQDGGAALAVDAHHDLENLLGELRTQAQAGLVEQDQVGVGHERTRDRQHLLLATRR